MAEQVHHPNDRRHRVTFIPYYYCFFLPPPRQQFHRPWEEVGSGGNGGGGGWCSFHHVLSAAPMPCMDAACWPGGRVRGGGGTGEPVTLHGGA